MRRALVLAILISVYATAPRPSAADADRPGRSPSPHAGFIRVDNADLYFRTIGQGQPVIVLHGGPDFDHSYLLPDMDRFSDSYRLIYYDQRGRGKSANRVRPEDVSLESDVRDLDAVREQFHLRSTALLGHSWGAVLALEYAIRYPDRVSHLILMNPAPASKDDFMLLRKERPEKLGAADWEKLQRIAASAAYKEGDPDAVIAYYRIHFRPALQRSEDLDKLIATFRASFEKQGKEGILKARQVESRLMNDTWLSEGYDLLPQLQRLQIPTLVIYGDHDFLPEPCAAHIAQAIPGARFVTERACGHFPYLECPDAVRKDIDDFFHAASVPARPHPSQPSGSGRR